jgi:ABC-type spermidine/putrescine transport system permease subunit I
MTAGTPPLAPERARSVSLPRLLQGNPRSGARTFVLLVPALVIAIGFLFYPLVFIVQMSFTEGSSYLSPSGPIQTTANYTLLVSRYLPNLAVTLQLALLATIVDLIFGFPFAYILVRRVHYRDVVRALMVFPMFGALYIAFGLQFILLPGGPATPVLQAFGVAGTEALFSLPTVVFAMSIFTFPFMVLNIGTALGNVDPQLEEAAACLGARPWQTFRRVILPLTRAGTIAGMLTVFGWSIGTFAEPLLLGSINEQRALAWTVYQRGVVQTDYGLSTAMGCVLLLVAFVVSYLSLRYSRGALVQ